MQIELEQLITHFTQILFKVQGVYRFTIKPGTTGWENTSPFPGIIFPLCGQAQYHFNATPYHAKPGNIILGGADMRLDKQVLGNSEWEYICVLYDVHSPESKDFRLSDFHTDLTVGNSLHLTDLLYRLDHVSRQSGILPVFQQDTLFRCILDEVFVCADKQTRYSPKILFERICSYIHEHYKEEFSIAELSQQHGMSENQLYYLFQKYAGSGAGQYLMNYRLNAAHKLLTAHKIPIKEAAASVGYSDALYFSRQFHKRFGLSPSAVRDRKE